MSEFVNTCQILVSDKVTERKNASRRLREFLKEESICKQLDGHGGWEPVQISWEGLFTSVKEYILKETEHIMKLEKGKRQISETTMASRNQMKKEVAETMRMFLRAANNRGFKTLKIKDVLRHILYIVRHPNLSLLLRKEYSSMLLHDILTCHQYMMDVQASQWIELLDFYCGCFHSPETLSSDLTARIINSLIVQSSVQYDLDIHKLYVFFEKSLKSVITNIDSKSSVIEPLLAALNKYCSVAAPNARGRLCRLGEEGLVLPLLHIWERSSLSIKTQIIEFLWTQIKIHHPRGSCTEAEGSWAYDDDKWGECIDKMYEMVLRELESTSKRLKWTSAGDGFMSPLFIDLSVNIMYQVFHKDSQTTGTTEPLTKKRKVAPKRTILMEQLINCSRAALLTWLQVISHMLKQWPGEFPISELPPLLCELYKLLKDESRSECTHWLLICLKTVALSSHNVTLTSELKDVWKKIWDTCLRSKLCQEDCLALLTVMAKNFLVEVDHEPWKLLSTYQPTRSFVTFVAALLDNHKLPESFLPTNPMVISDSTVIHQFPLRTALLQFLLPSNEMLMRTSSESLPRVENRPNASLMAQVLVALTQQSCSLLDSSTDLESAEEKWVTPEYHTHLEAITSLWQEIEMIYLYSSLHLNPLNVRKDPPSSKKKDQHVILIPPLCQFLWSLLEKNSTFLMQFKPDRVATLADSIESLVYQFTVIITVAGLMSRCGMEEGKLQTLPAVSRLSDLLNSASLGLRSRFWNESNLSIHYKVLKQVIGLLTSLMHKSQASPVVRKLFLNSFTDELLTTVYQLALHKYEVVSPSDSMTSTGFDDVDMMYSSPSGESHSPISNSSSIFLSFSLTSADIFNSNVFSERSVLQIEACEFVVDWHKTGMDKDFAAVANGEVDESWTVISQLVSDERSDLSSAKALHLVFIIANNLLTLSPGLIRNEILMDLVSCIRKVLSSNRRNQAVYEHSLKILSALAPHISSSGDNETHSVYINLVSVFCNLHGDSALTALVRSTLAQTLLTVYDKLPAGVMLTTKDGDVSADTVLLSMLNDPHHSVRMKMAVIASSLFYRGGQPLPSQQQEKLFKDKITSKLERAGLVESNLDPLSLEDESVNRITSTLCVLEGVACSSPSCEQHVVSRMISDVGKGKVADVLIMKAIDNVASYLGFSGSTPFLEEMLSFLVMSWLKEGRLEDFPFTLFRLCSLQEFIRKYSNHFIPHVLWSCDHSLLQTVSKLCDQPLTDLLRNCLSTCMVFIITNFAECDKVGVEREAKRTLGTSCYDYLVSILTADVLQDTMKHSLNEFVVELLSRMFVSHGSDSFLAKYMSPTDPPPLSPHYSPHVVQSTLDYLPSCYFSPGLSFVSTMSRKKDMIQSILLSLNLRLFSTHRLFQRKYILLSYSLFVRLICQELKTGLGGSLSYVVMDVIYSILRILDHHTHNDLIELFPVACDTLYCLLKAAIRDCPKSLDPHYHILFGKLLPFAKNDSKEGKQAPQLFKYLIEHGDHQTLVGHVTILDPLPNEPRFSDFNERIDSLKAFNSLPLNEELDRFSSVSVQLYNSEGLEHLHKVLTERRSIVHDVINRNDPYVKNPVVDFLQALIFLSKNVVSSDDRVAISRISRCMGDIGYMDIPCIALPQKGSTRQKTLGQVFDLLAGFLCDTDIKVVKETANCLKALLSTPDGSSLLKKVEENSDSNLGTLEPFKIHKKKKNSGTHSRKNILQASPSIRSWASSGSSHSKWLTQLVLDLLSSGLVTNEVLLLLSPVCEVKVELCEWVFPLLVYDILQTGSSTYSEKLSYEVQTFLVAVNNDSSLSIQTASINTILDMLMYLRTKNQSNKSSAWDSNFWLSLDFLEVSKAAMLSSSYFIALLYIEIWYAHQMNSIYEMEGRGEEVPYPLQSNPTVECQLLSVYDNIGEPDSLYGAIILYSPQEELRKRLYEHQGQWDKALSMYNWQLLSGSSSTHSHVVEVFKNLGFPQILDMYVKGAESSGAANISEFREFQYEAAWRYMTTSNWSDYTSRTSSVSSEMHTHGFNSLVSSCLSAIRQNERVLFEDCLYSSRYNLLKDLCSSSNHSVCRLHPYLTKLQCLQELEEIGKVTFENNVDTSKMIDLLADWKHRLSFMGTDFQYIDLVLSMRVACIHSLLKKDELSQLPVREQLFSELHHILSTSAKLAREAGKYQIAEAAYFTLKHLTSELADIHSPELSYYSCLEEAELCWAQGEKSLALMLISKLVDCLQNCETLATYSESVYLLALCKYGSWLAETKSQNPVVIMRDYLQKATSLMEAKGHEELVQGYLTLARFADSQYKNLTRQMETKRHEEKKQLHLESKKELQTIQKLGSTSDRSFQRHYRQLQVQSNEDELIFSQQIQDQRSFLKIALSNYLKCLRAGNEHDLRIFRVCSLWFNNSTDKDITRLMQDGISELASMKFLPLIYQLAARMSSSSHDPFQKTLQELLHNICVDHPYHSLYVILALSNASLDNEFPQSNYVTGTRGCPTAGKRMKKSSTGAGTTTKSVDEDKVKAAKELVAHLQSTHPVIVKNISLLCEAYIDLAYHDVSVYRTEKNPIKLPPSCPLLKVSLNSIAVPTMDLPVDPTCQYASIVYVNKFDNHITLCGGINLPKVISCQGSDGYRRRQLIKGKDDLRQDAVMQQVFSLVNQLLLKEPSTAKRKLAIRTYKAVPLSQCSGIVEWCEGTMPIGQYLIGTNENPYEGAHSRYRPKDWTSKDCRKKFAAAQSKEDKQSVYKAICSNFKPVFHHFFMETFLSPSLWFERRLAYTRSIAASSIVGYVVGLGDRHIQNILVDKQTAELIHIDFGVAFEQGKTLPTPELIPFRLTRDLVDGMGITGVEGVFRRCCEEVMTVMRSSQEELKTIVEVLLCDPLYQWNIPIKVQTLQGRSPAVQTESMSTSSNAKKMAERVLIRLQEKLEGIEDGTLLSVSGQVSHLIQEATDPLNLCALFHGWQPWV